LKLVSWNVNGLRAALGKGFGDFFAAAGADIFCVQEIKMMREQADIDLPGYYQYWNSAQRKGYSGTAVFSKAEPLAATMDFEGHATEGRVTALEYGRFFLVNVYSPNAQPELARISYRMEWEDSFRSFVTGLDAKKPVIICGDMNVARSPIDLKNPKPNEGQAGYSEQERGKMEQLLSSGFTDSFRYLYPDREGAYTWWTYRFNARANNAGWRIDYFLVSDRIKDDIEDSVIYSDIYGSDHCPIGLTIEL